MNDSLVRYSAADGIATLELCDPPANTYTHEMMLQLDDAILRARFDPGVHVMVLRGHGEKFFCAGRTSGCCPRPIRTTSTTSVCMRMRP